MKDQLLIYIYQYSFVDDLLDAQIQRMEQTEVYYYYQALLFILDLHPHII